MIDSVAEGATPTPDLKRARRRKSPAADGASNKVDRLPPHSPEAEQGVLGCILLAPNESVGQCIETLRSGAEEFYDLRHQTIFTALTEMYDSREAIDVITVQQRLKDKQLLEQVGGIAYLS
ncbi:MAG TPA: DnaB-like helicase N-terminal domain-containing protein, partial [Bacillota bacterium]|nr:DnaB-like helicase N-terminal domain-containing protein [Bacillota bacterium]